VRDEWEHHRRRVVRVWRDQWTGCETGEAVEVEKGVRWAHPKRVAETSPDEQRKVLNFQERIDETGVKSPTIVREEPFK
jgi:hypothetical protein